MFVHANYSIITQSLTFSLRTYPPNNDHTISCNQLSTFTNYQVSTKDYSGSSTFLSPLYNTLSTFLILNLPVQYFTPTLVANQHQKNLPQISSVQKCLSYATAFLYKTGNSREEEDCISTKHQNSPAHHLSIFHKATHVHVTPK